MAAGNENSMSSPNIFTLLQIKQTIDSRVVNSPDISFSETSNRIYPSISKYERQSEKLTNSSGTLTAINSNLQTAVDRCKDFLQTRSDDSSFVGDSSMCPHCDFIYTNGLTMIAHLQTHYGTSLHKCRLCSKSFTKESDLQCHILSHGLHSCSECSQTFDSQELLISHKVSHKCDNSADQKDVFQSNFLPHSILDSSGKIFPSNSTDNIDGILENNGCSLCGESFTTKSNLAKHMKIHHDVTVKPFQCDICKKRFIRKNHLQRHQSTHTGEKPHQCTICDRRFTEKSSLKMHLMIHSGDKPRKSDGTKKFKCSICEKMFSKNSNLKTHMLIHAKVKRFTCLICNKLFAQNKDLKMHNEKKHKEQ